MHTVVIIPLPSEYDEERKYELQQSDLESGSGDDLIEVLEDHKPVPLLKIILVVCATAIIAVLFIVMVVLCFCCPSCKRCVVCKTPNSWLFVQE